MFYGFSHQRTITATQKAQHDKHEWDQKQKTIDQAKAEYAKKTNPPVSSNDGTLCPTDLGIISRAPARGEGDDSRRKVDSNNADMMPVVTDPADPKFDLEKLLLKVSEEKA